MKRQKNLRHFVILTKTLAKINFKLQSEGRILGIFWHILNPLLAFGALFIIFSAPIGQNIEKYPLYLLLGLIIFNFFLQTTNQAVRIIREQRIAIQSIDFPQESLVSSLVLSHFFIHLIEIVIFSLVLLFFGLSLKSLLFYLPVIVGLTFFTYGFSLILSALTSYLLDLENIWHHGVRLLWFLTPIFYSLPEQSIVFKFNYYFNPMFQYIDVSRDLLIYQKFPDPALIAMASIYTLTIFILGSFTFRKLKHKFAEII